MRLERISLRNFRNFESEAVEFPREGAALIGPNGQGKTNFLEAIYYLEVFRSFRGARDEQLVRFGTEGFHVKGCLAGGEGDDEVEIAAGYVRDGRRKKVSVNGAEVDRIADGIGRVGAIIFTASDIEIVSGSPSARRRFLDIVLSLVEPGYVAALQRYRQILTQRNELLRAPGEAPALAAWDEALVAEGARIMESRARWVRSARGSFSGFYEQVSGGQAADMKYSPSVGWPETEGEGAPTREEWAEAFWRSLDRVRGREKKRGITLRGPHRDDVRLGIAVEAGERSALALRTFGSAGEQRTAAVALRMVEAETLRFARGLRPIVMLDDVFAELDPDRGERIVGILGMEEWGQVIVTSPKPDDLALMGGKLDQYRVLDGSISRA